MPASQLSKPLEREIQKSILEYLKMRGHKVFRRNTGTIAIPETERHARRFLRFSEAGQSDIWGITKETGQHFEIEVKRPGEKPTLTQAMWLAEMKEAGCLTLVARSIEDVQQAGL